MIRVAPFAPLRASQRDAGYVVGFGWVFFLAAFVRVTYIMASRFPLHDGGLFFQMIQDLQAAHYRLPLVTSYNQAGIPFAYPPLAFYVAGWLSDLMHWPLIGVLWLLPPFLSLLCLGAFVLLAQRLLPDRGLVILASLAFALAPRAYDWLIMGGGLTRAFGQLFALLFLHRLHRVYTVRRRADVVLAAAFGAATVLSHLEWTYFAAYSALVFLAILGRDRWSMAASAVIAAGSALISAPWWVTVLSRDGLAPFIAAVTGSSHDWPLYSGVVAFLTLRWTEEPLFPLLTALAILGFLLCVNRRSWLLPVWLLTIFIVESRGTVNRSIIPMALLAALGLFSVMEILARRIPIPSVFRQDDHSLFPAGRLARLLLIIAGIYLAFSSLIWPRLLLQGLSPGEQAAMGWVRENTPPSSQFLLITSDDWGVDRSQEWFPVLADRVSVTTTQGYEWIPGAFAKRSVEDSAVQQCANSGLPCLQAWEQKSGVRFDYLYVAKRPGAMPVLKSQRTDCCAVLRNSLKTDASFVTVFDGPGAVIYRRIGVAGSRASVASSVRGE